MRRSVAHRGVPTTYASVRFRSRLESRWAALWDQLQVPWFYEPPTDDLAGGWLPDFMLAGSVLAECKPARDARELEPAMKKAEDSGYQGRVLLLGLSPAVALSAQLRGDGKAAWRPARWSVDTRLAWALAGNSTQWRARG